MSKCLILCTLTILSMLLMSLPVSQAQTFSLRDLFIPISSYDDDPYVKDSIVERVNGSRFDRGEDGRPILSSNVILQEDEPVIYRQHTPNGDFEAFAWNPWSPEMRLSNDAGNFMFTAEERFPLHRVERGADGKIVLKDGLQVWLPQNLHRGMTTAFEAVNAAKDAVEFWSGRELAWGKDGKLLINTHAFIDFNAFYSPTSGGLFFGVVPYRRAGQEIRMFEMATSWEIAAHEAGHALERALKPNNRLIDPGNRTWSESFGDQIAMWASLRDPDRVSSLLADTGGDLNQSSALTRIGEALGGLLGEDVELRDAFHNKKVSDTTTEIHDRSEVLTGAVYKFFVKVYEGLRTEHNAEEALRKSSEIMGIFATRANDFTPENSVTLEDVAKAYLKVDMEFFNLRYHAILLEEFTRREIFDADSVSEWIEHESAIPNLHLPPRATDEKVEKLVQENLEKLGIGPDFGLKLQSVTPGNRLKKTKGLKETIVRVQLTQGRGVDATPLDNHGILVFRANGTLADYHSPLPSGNNPSPLADGFVQAQALDVIGQANGRASTSAAFRSRS